MKNRFDQAPPTKLPGLLLLVVTISACTTFGESPDAKGKFEHRIHCSGSGNTWDTCDREATEICDGKEYEVIDRYEDRGALAAYDSARVLPERILTIKCKQ